MLPSGRRHHPSCLVPPAWFRTTSTVFSALKFAGLLHPAAGRGVRRVSRKPAPPGSRPLATREWSAMRAGASAGLAPRDASTLRRVPPVRSQYRVTAALLPPCRWVSPGTFAPCSPLLVGKVAACQARSSTSRRFSANGSVALDTLASGKSLVPSMGLCPLRGPIPIRGFLGLSQGDPEQPRGEVPSGRPSRRWRYTGGGALDIPACAVCPEGSFARIPKEPCKPP
jgi:hypothetical protein